MGKMYIRQSFVPILHQLLLPSAHSLSTTIPNVSFRKLLLLRKKELFSKDNVFITGKPSPYFLHSLDCVVSRFVRSKLRSI